MKIWFISCNKPQGKLTGYIFRYILDKQWKIYITNTASELYHICFLHNALPDGNLLLVHSAVNQDESYSPYCKDHFKVTIAAKYWEMCSFTGRDFDQLDGYYYSWSQLLCAVWLALFSLWSTRQIWRIHPFTSQLLDSISLLQCMPHHCYCPDQVIRIHCTNWDVAMAKVKRQIVFSPCNKMSVISRQPLNISQGTDPSVHR